MTKPDGPLTKAGILDYSGGGRIRVHHLNYYLKSPKVLAQVEAVRQFYAKAREPKP